MYSAFNLFSTDRQLYSQPHIPCEFPDICSGYQHIKDTQRRVPDSENGDKPSERTATGRTTSLREISHTGWREWDNHSVELKGTFGPLS